jgi:hypothetical protein
VFELVKSGTTYTEIVLHSFTESGGDGYRPNAELIMDSSGNLYGTTLQGGANTSGQGDYGTVFELAAPLRASMPDTILHSFTGTTVNSSTPGGGNPRSGLIMDSSGNLYGTTQQGEMGVGPCSSSLLPLQLACLTSYCTASPPTGLTPTRE